MSPPERELDTSNPVHAFAAELRTLRAQAGRPPFLVMARRSGGVGRTALAEAVGGDHMPTWRTVEGFVRACRRDPEEWLARYEQLQEQLGQRREAAGEAPPATAGQPQARRSRWTRPAAAALLIVATAAAVHALDVLMSPTRAAGRPPALTMAGVAIVVQNKVALGPTELIEDSTPAFLSSRPVPYCSHSGCEVPDTNLSSGAAVIADCQVTSVMMYNYNLDSSESKTNPNRAASTLWYHVLLRNGARGFLTEVYIEPQYRGGMGLPVCPIGHS